MKKLVMTLGVMGAGKSSFLEKNGLTPYTISPDTLRLLYAGPHQKADGRIEISAKNEKQVWSTLKKVVAKRLENGDFTIVDATNVKVSIWQDFLELCSIYQAECICLDFRGLSLDELKKRNLNRPPFKQVPEASIEKAYFNITHLKLPKGVKVIQPEQLMEKLKIQPIDISHYEKVVLFGDIHGCATVLKRYFEEHPFNEDTFYVFTGDYVDRGIENFETIQFLQNMTYQRNVVFLKGNHEEHLIHWVQGKQISSREFKNFTQKELEKQGYTKKKGYSFIRALRDYFYFEFHGKRVFVSHGGIVKVPETELDMPMNQFIHGVEGYDFDIDNHFQGNEHLIQVHGHRNLFMHSIEAGPYSYNLEGRIEKGEDFRILVIDKDKVFPLSYKNPIFSPRQIRGHKNFGNLALLQELRQNDGIRENELGQNLSSFNFKKNVFYNNDWDERRIKTRGLFMNTNTTEIIARGYDKFFNINERPETTWESLAKRTKGPYKAYLKENGFIGFLGYDSDSNQLIISTKSTINGEHNDYFHHILDKLLTPMKKEKLEHILKERNLSLAVEVIDPIHNPHIITYSKPEIVLLDAIYREDNFRKLPYEELLQLHQELNLGIRVKQQTKVCTTFDELKVWLDSQDKFENEIEGYVIEDSQGYHFKAKLVFYRYWKWVRGEMNRLLKGRAFTDEFIHHPLTKKYHVISALKQLKEEHEEWLINDDIPAIRQFILEMSSSAASIC